MSRYLKSIDLFGFKSFPVKTHIEFVDGITGIVGANGSGKSNVVESLKWVLGEQSAKTLRGEKMEDIIFNGTKDRSAMGMAEVALTFENNNRWLPLDYTEVAIQRRLFRSGEGQYYINKNRVRLKDVVELFLDTGVGRDSYAIFEQGKIDRLLSESPTDRRSLFEDFAGISKFKFRKEEAEKKLENSRLNLERVNDIMVQLEKEVVSLKEQAENAERYNDLKNSLRALELRFEALRIRNFENEILNKYSQKKKAEEKLAPLSEELKAREEALARSEVEVQEHEAEFNTVRDTYAHLQREFGETESRLKTNRERKDVLTRQLSSMETRLKEGVERSKTLADELSLKSGELDAATEDKEAVSDALAEIQAKIDALMGEIKRLDSRILSESRELGFDRILSKDDIEKQKAELIAAQTKLENYRASLEERFTANQALTAEIEEKTAMESLLLKDAQKWKSELDKVMSEMTVVSGNESELKAKNQKLSLEARELQAALKNMDRAIMESIEKQSVELKGFTARKPALEARLESALQELSDSLSGGSAASAASAAGKIKDAIREYKTQYESILGILYSDEGTYTRKEKTQERIEEIAEQAAANETGAEKLRRRHQELQTVREGIQNNYNKSDYELTALRAELKKMAERLSAAETAYRELENQIQAASQTIQKKQTLIERMVTVIDSYDEEIRELKNERAGHYDELNRRRVDYARAEEKYKSLLNEISRIKNQVSDIERMRQNYETEHANSLAVIEELESRIDTDSERMTEFEARITGMQKDIENRREQIAGLQKSRKAMELQRREIEDSIQKLDRNVANIESIIAEKKSFVESIIQKSQETYLMDVRTIELNDSDNLDETARSITELRTSLSSLGDVNLLAIEQYHNALEKLQFLQTQKMDSERAMEDIQKLIDETNSKCVEQFTSSFEDIRKAFKKIFARLFDGGRADLVLMDDKNPLESGINIFAEPPGKKFQAISLMSGGERALVAIAVIFSILYLKPTPFVVLDEMDAPLDDDNIERFKSLLKDFRQTSQFVIVSHSKSTLEVCDALYGVTMEEQGVSKLISVAFDEAQVLFKSNEEREAASEA